MGLDAGTVVGCDGDADAPLFRVPRGGFLRRGGRCWMVADVTRVDHSHLHKVVPPFYAAARHFAPGFHIEDVVTGARHLVVLD